MNFKKVFLPLAILLSLGVVGCAPSTIEPIPTTSVDPSVPPSSDVSEPTTLPELPSGTDVWEFDANYIDYVHNDPRAKLNLDYKDSEGNSRDFFTDGVGQVKLKSHIDGDTAHFTPITGDTYKNIKARYYGIDTPESTGSIEKWGKSASNFNKMKLEEANENGTIVLSSPSETYAAPQVDSTGSRYLAVIWINESVKNADFDELYCLNLWIVQEGYSAAKSLDKIPHLKDVFLEADIQAYNYGVRMRDDSNYDPNWNDNDYFPVNIIAIKDQERWSQEDGDPETENPYYGMNVTIEGTVTGYSNHIVYVQEYYTFDELKSYLDDAYAEGNVSQAEYERRLEEGKDGAYAGIGLFTGMSFSSNEKYTTPNTRLRVNGQVGYQFGLQIQGISFPSFYSGGINEVEVLATAQEVLENEEYENYRVHNFDVNSTDLKHDDTYLFMKVNVLDELVVTGGKDDKEDGEVRLDVETKDGEKLDFSINLNFIFKPDAENYPRRSWKSYKYFVQEGATIKVKGIYYFFEYDGGSYTSEYYNVLPTMRADIELINYDVNFEPAE